MDDILTRHGFRVAVMKADAVAPERREAWVEERVKQGIDVMICHLRLVQTGLDLIDFPTLCWFETDYSVYVMRQASRRSWRIGQTRPVKVVFMSYRNTLQADALKLVAKKLQSSLAVEGELPEDGLAAYGDDGDDVMMALARRIVQRRGGRGRDGGGGLRPGKGRRGHRRGAAGGRRLEGRRDRAGGRRGQQPASYWIPGRRASRQRSRGHRADGRACPVNGHYTNGNGNGHAAIPMDRNDYHDEAEESQQTLFSWAEFMAEEPVKPKGRGRKPQPAATSLFEWALEMEQEREEEPVGVGR